MDHSQDRILLLGCPVDRISQGDLEDVILNLIESYFVDGETKLATSITALFLGKLSGFTLSYRIMPQVVTTLRNADFIGINSKELQLLARLLGNKIPCIVRPEDLLLSSASVLSKNNQQSMFLLGGNEELCNNVKTALSLNFPGLKIIGAEAPKIYTKGIELIESINTDDAIVEMIHRASPTILALHLGHPKLEIWFERIRKKIKVPLVIGIGGAFEPYLARKLGKKIPLISPLSWEKLKQKILSLLHYTLWLPPLITYNSLNHLIYNLFYKSTKKPPYRPSLFLSQKESLFIVPLPPFINRNSWEKAKQSMEAALEYENIILDFTPVYHFNPSGIGLISNILKQTRFLHKNVFIIGLKGDVQLLLKLHGAWDLISPYIVQSPDEILQRLSANKKESLLREHFFLSIDQIEDQTTVGIFGRLHGYTEDELEPFIRGRSLKINLHYCTAINNLGFAFLLTLREYQKKQKLPLTIENSSPFIRQQFKYYKLESYFNFA